MDRLLLIYRTTNLRHAPTYPWLAATRLIPGLAVDARASLAVVSPSYHGDGCIRFGRDPWGYMADSGQA